MEMITLKENIEQKLNFCYNAKLWRQKQPLHDVPYGDF